MSGDRFIEIDFEFRGRPSRVPQESREVPGSETAKPSATLAGTERAADSSCEQNLNSRRIAFVAEISNARFATSDASCQKFELARHDENAEHNPGHD